MVANFRESDTAPKEEWVNQDAGLTGRGGSHYINGVVLRNKDANTAWTSASDGTLEERIYLCQNWRGDVSALVYANGDQVEQVRYSPYGTPFGLPGGDTDSDGDCDSPDVTQIQAWINAAAYDVRADIDLDGDVDATDKSAAQAAYQGLTLGRDKHSSLGSKRGWAGYLAAVPIGWYEARNRSLTNLLGRWGCRDRLTYVDGVNLYAYTESRPVAARDPMGQSLAFPGAGGAFPGIMYSGGLLGMILRLLEPPKPRIPPCPSTRPVNNDGEENPGDGWCVDWAFAGMHPGAAACYRSYGTGTVGGQQCCYNANGQLITEGPAGGTIDQVGIATGEHTWFTAGVTAAMMYPGGGGGSLPQPHTGGCQYSMGQISQHIITDVAPCMDSLGGSSENCQCIEGVYDAIGVPSGSEGGFAYSDGISDDELSAIHNLASAACAQQ